MPGEFEIEVEMRRVWGDLIYYAYNPAEHFNEFAHSLYDLIAICAGVWVVRAAFQHSNDPLMRAVRATDDARWSK